MEDSFKGLLITLTIIGLFTTAILSFIVIFPQEQGVAFNDLASKTAYVQVNNTNLQIQPTLTTIKNDSQNAFNQWDITQGFMGSNTIKQTSDSSVDNYNTNIFQALILMATTLFGTNSPIVYAIGVLFVLSGSVIVYIVIKLVRQGS